MAWAIGGKADLLLMVPPPVSSRALSTQTREVISPAPRNADRGSKWVD